MDSRILWFNTDEADEKFKNGGSKRLTELLSECTGVICYNDQIALKIMDALKENGLNIPEDLSLVSFDDSQLATASEVKLTTVAHPKERLGEAAGEAILNMVSRNKSRFNEKIRPELIIRGSTRKIV